MRTYTKRTMGFQRRLEDLDDKLTKLIDACDVAQKRDLKELLMDVRQILERNTTDSGCILSSRDEDRIFTLKEKDPLFLPTLRFWIDQAKELGIHVDRIEDAEELYRNAANS